tara:strand:- start:467 stop:913 length:447 start_codon:yes stop_codon:yes gene_type:complete
MAKQDEGSFYLKPSLKQVARNMGDRPAFRKGDGFFGTLKKIGNTALRVGGELGVQALDLLQGDPGNTGGSTNSFNMGGSRAAKSEAGRAKDFENEYFDESRRQVNEGKQFFTLADYLDDDGSTFFAKDARSNKGTTSYNSKKNSPKGS